MASQSKIEQIPLSELDWGSIGRIFDEKSKNGVDEIYYFFLELLSEKDVCKDNKCIMFDELQQLDESRSELKYQTVDDARDHISDEMEFDDVKTSIETWFFQARKLFNIMVRTSSTRQTRIDEEEVYHKRNIELINAMVKSNHPLDVQFANTVSAVIKNNSELGEMSEQLRKDQEEKEKLAKSQEKKKSDEKV